MKRGVLLPQAWRTRVGGPIAVPDGEEERNMGLSGFTFALPYAPGDQPFQRPVVTALRIVNFARIGLFLQTPLASPPVVISAWSTVHCGLRCAAIHYFPPRFHQFFTASPRFIFLSLRSGSVQHAPLLSLSLSIPSHSSFSITDVQLCCARHGRGPWPSPHP
jgi:hypothetical protein